MKKCGNKHLLLALSLAAALLYRPQRASAQYAVKDYKGQAGNVAEADSLVASDSTLFLRQTRFPPDVLTPKLCMRMAVFSARLKAYAQSLKYYYLSLKLKEKQKPWVKNEPPDTLSDSMLIGFVYDKDSSVSDTLLIHAREQTRKGGKLKLRDITQPFRDGEQGIAYGVLLHIKQPSPGSRRAYTFINNVGHMFVTLVKYELDGSHVSRTFGFYPNKDNILSATPLLPRSSAVFKDDADHQWDETVAKFITKKQFKSILRKINQYGRKRYHLNKNNCTDFGLTLANAAGIIIEDTQGSWPLGSGNDPGDAGQSVLEGKVTDTGNSEDLFICTYR
ncbi:MAG: hypothetical protein QM642_03910 [Edaphocola sp.]